MGFYDCDGRKNYFIEFGRGTPVVLLHGISNSGRAWAPQVAPLVQAGFRVIIPDQAGHGASARLTRPFTVMDLARDVRVMLDTMGIDSADIVGLSLGGMVGLQLALSSPDRTRRLVVANSFPSSASAEFRLMAQSWAAAFRAEDGPVARLEATWPLNVNESFRSSEEGLRTYQVWHGVAATADGESLAHVAEGIVHFDVGDKLGSLTTPTLFISGGGDLMSPPAISRKMADAVPRAQYVEIEGAAHISNVDSPQQFNAAVVPFLKQAM
jgi:3-oxoadipate enol-lactonase